MSKYVVKGERLEKEGNLEGALNSYEMAINDSACPFDIRSYTGRVNNKQRNFNDAFTSFDSVLNMDDNHINSLFGKGIACLGLNKWDEALDLFLKAIEIDNTNANFYYYISIIYQSKCDEKAQEYYSKFIELDNEEFEQIRSDYGFGLIFLNAELELDNDDKIINLKAFEDVNELTDLDYAENEKKIIREQYLQMGFRDEDVDDYFVMDTVDVLKEDIISRTNNNPFPDKNEIDIPLYVEVGKYIFEELVIEEKLTKRVKNKLKRIKDRNKAVETVYRHHYATMMEAISNNDFEYAKWFSDFIDESKISDESFKVNFIYIRGLILSYLNLDLNKVLEDFNLLEKDFPEITIDKNYIHNKKSIQNDLEKSN